MIGEYKFKVIATGFSDHYAQVLPINTKDRFGKVRKSNTVRENFKIVRSCTEEDIEYLNFHIIKESWNTVLHQTTVNGAFDEFLNTFNYYHNIAVPKKRIKIKQKTNNWVTIGIKALGRRLKWLKIIMKIGNVNNEFKNYYSRYKKYITK
ncbi:hypothetical protein C0J52_14129 [Blattella germanica]|nr:hypothetical protein C0J52_14129 [Blattella germanica]